jgi:hypothetical protein
MKSFDDAEGAQDFIDDKVNKMKRVLIADEKHCLRVFDVSTVKLKDEAYLSLFKERNKDGYYSDVKNNVLFNNAKSGDAVAAQRFIAYRNQHEYEKTYETNVE